MSLDGDGLLVTVSDSGNGIAPHPRKRGLGMGLSLIGRVSDGLEIKSSAKGGTLLLMRFALNGEVG